MTRSNSNYFAYGSNLHPARLEQRIGESKVTSVAYLRNATTRFNKIGLDGSGKCNLELMESSDDTVVGVIYRITKQQRQILDDWESQACGYKVIEVEPHANGNPLAAFTYVAIGESVNDAILPFDWYKALVLVGALYHGFPAHYVGRLQQQESVSDPDVRRAAENADLVVRLCKLTKHSTGVAVDVHFP